MVDYEMLGKDLGFIVMVLREHGVTQKIQGTKGEWSYKAYWLGDSNRIRIDLTFRDGD